MGGKDSGSGRQNVVFFSPKYDFSFSLYCNIIVDHLLPKNLQKKNNSTAKYFFYLPSVFSNQIKNKRQILTIEIW